MAKTTLEIQNYNDDFLIIKSQDSASLASLGRGVHNSAFDFVDEVISTESEVCIKLNDRFNNSKLELIKGVIESDNPATLHYNLPIYFNDHPDWSTVERIIGLSKKEIVSKLTSTKFSLAMFGFLPGFLYLKGLDKQFHVPRKTIPAKYIKANSLALGGPYVGLYSIDSPGGWHVIGDLPIRLLDFSSLPPIDMNPGDTIQLHAITESEYQVLLSQELSLNDCIS